MIHAADPDYILNSAPIGAFIHRITQLSTGYPHPTPLPPINVTYLTKILSKTPPKWLKLSDP